MGGRTTNGTRYVPNGMPTTTKTLPTAPAAAARIDPSTISKKPRRGTMLFARRTPPNERDARNDTRARRKSQVEPHQFERYERVQRLRRYATPAYKHERGRPRERNSTLSGNKRIIGSPVKDSRRPQNEEHHKDARMATSPTPPSQNLRRDAPFRNPYRGENHRNTKGKTCESNKQIGAIMHQRMMIQRHTWGPSLSQRNSEMQFTLLSEVGDAALQDMAQDRIAIGAKQNMNAKCYFPPLTETTYQPPTMW